MPRSGGAAGWPGPLSRLRRGLDLQVGLKLYVGPMSTTGGRSRIPDVADRPGFSTPPPRYYESIGLLPPADRTESGYRVYDDRSVERLTFIARAKQLGCTLEEITELAR